MRLEAGFDVVLYLGPQRAALDGEFHPDGDEAPGRHLDVGGHAEVDDVGPELRVDDGSKQLSNLVDCRWRNGAVGHALNLPMCRVSLVMYDSACHHTPCRR